MHVIVLLFIVQRTDEALQWDKIDGFMKHLFECNNAASLAVSAVKGGATVFNNVYGEKDKGVPANNNTRYSIGSISKGFTSYLIGTHVEKGALHWTDTLVDIFSSYDIKFTMKGEYRTNSATLIDALAHRTGLKQYDWLLSDDRPFTSAQWVTQFLPQFEQFAEMREKFYYNNWLYTLGGYATELAAGKPFTEQVKEVIFKPLKMTATTFVTDDMYDMATPYKEGSDGVLYRIPLSALQTIGKSNPAGGIISTGADMAKYMIGILDSFNWRPSPLSRDILLNLTTPYMLLKTQLGPKTLVKKPIFNASFLDQGYGLGYIQGYYKGYEYMNHGGSAYGHYSFMTIIPSRDIGVFTVLSGADYQMRDNWKIQKIAHIYLLDVLLGEKSWITEDTACTFPLPWQNMEEFVQDPTVAEEGTTIANSSKFVGVYSKDVFPDILINGTDTELRFTMGNINGSIVPVNEAFSVILTLPTDPVNLPIKEKSRAGLRFTRDGDKIVGVTVTNAPEVFTFTRNGSHAFGGLLTCLVVCVLLGVLPWLQD